MSVSIYTTKRAQQESKIPNYASTGLHIIGFSFWQSILTYFDNPIESYFIKAFG